MKSNVYTYSIEDSTQKEEGSGFCVKHIPDICPTEVSRTYQNRHEQLQLAVRKRIARGTPKCLVWLQAWLPTL